MANTGGIKATVINIQNNQPVAGATIKLSGPADQSTQTGPDGSFEFSNLPPGNDYHLDVSANGFNPSIYQEIVVIEDVVTDLHKLALWPIDD